MRTTGMCGERIVAWTVVVAVHAVLAMLLLRSPAPIRPGIVEETALEVVWVPAVRPQSPRTRAMASPGPERSRAARKFPVGMPTPEPEAEAEAMQDTGAKPLSAIFLAQARLPASDAAEQATAGDPFANRGARLPGREAHTFRMRPPPSLAERVAAVGRMFGGGDDPCRSARDSINALSQAGDSRALQDALDYEKRFCR